MFCSTIAGLKAGEITVQNLMQQLGNPGLQSRHRELLLTILRTHQQRQVSFILYYYFIIFLLFRFRYTETRISFGLSIYPVLRLSGKRIYSLPITVYFPFCVYLLCFFIIMLLFYSYILLLLLYFSLFFINKCI